MNTISETKVRELFSENDETLEHSGVLGMKWGVRRYQNEDGTLTEEGKARYGKKSEYDSKSNTWKPSEARNLSDDELNRRNSRLQREKQYRDMTEPPMRKETKQALKTIFFTSAVAITAAAVTKKYKKLLEVGSDWLKNGGARKFLGAAARARSAKWLL